MESGKTENKEKQTEPAEDHEKEERTRPGVLQGSIREPGGRQQGKNKEQTEVEQEAIRD